MFFDNTEQLPPDPVLGVGVAYNNDPTPTVQSKPDDLIKVNVGVGTYKDENGAAYVMPVVAKAERAVVDEKIPSGKEYLPIDGLAPFRVAAGKLMFGTATYESLAPHMASTQALSGTGAVRLIAALLDKLLPKPATVYVSNPSWPNHKNIFLQAGFASARDYRYVTPAGAFDEAGMLADVRGAPRGSVFIVQACPHNPTGVDPTPAQWEAIARAVHESGHFVVVDSAYQGLASGDPAADAGPIPALAASGVEFAVCQSFSKTLSLYCERVGVLHVICTSPKASAAVLSQLKALARAMYSNPPAHGARIAARVLGTPELLAEWREDIKHMVARMNRMRTMLYAELQRLGTPGEWSCVTNQRGLFSLLPVTPQHVEQLRDKWHVYMMSSGRINIAGLTERTVPYFARALDDVVRHPKL
uniref:Aromatic aminotransferase 1 n=1 Tax=Mastigamoeba balamuthi TaxID=108607 RepID=A0A1S5RCW5_MASBA|nr:aromatic aminotransferase 1 [Mastigamoeba balamuthi]|eukprot:m51a1_g9054 putative aspartate aminotransferase (416) ;mRNA; f:45582-47262